LVPPPPALTAALSPSMAPFIECERGIESNIQWIPGGAIQMIHPFETGFKGSTLRGPPRTMT
jgi:hypothetical protein